MLSAQACNKGPGSAFGVTGYTCTECRVEWDKGTEQQYTFRSAPVVVSTTETSAIKPGDVIEAIDSRPITTREGAALFVSPSVGKHTFTLRRNRQRIEVQAEAHSCGDQPSSDRLVRVSPYPNPVTGKPNGGHADTTRGPGNAIAVNVDTGRKAGMTITKVSPAPSESQSKFGFAVACIPSCTKVTGSGALKVTYWKYDDYPLIAAVRSGGPAELAGLQNGDVITKVDGVSVLSETGGIKLFRSESASTLSITVRRDGKEIDFVLNAR